MNPEILKMVKECKIYWHGRQINGWGEYDVWSGDIEAFYKAAFNAGLEAAAKVCDKELTNWANTSSANEDYCTAYTIAARYIRALEKP